MPTQRGAEVHLVPWNYDISQDTYDGLFLSNGPGDPALAYEAIANLKKVQFADNVGFQERNNICPLLSNPPLSPCLHLGHVPHIQ